MPSVIDTVTRAQVLTQFEHALTHRFGIAEGARFNSLDAYAHFGLRTFVVETIEPGSYWFHARRSAVAEDFDHLDIVTCKLQK